MLRRRSNFRRRPKRRTNLRKKRIMRKNLKSLSSMKDKAHCVEVHLDTQVLGAATYTTNTNFSLADFPRALAISKNYRYFRATKVEVELIPYANVYAPGQAFPELYIQKDYTTNAATPAWTALSMQERGVLPMKWTNIVKRKCNPAVLRYENLQVTGYYNGSDNMVQDVQPLTATPVLNKWYMTEQVFTQSQFGRPQVTTQVGPSANPTQLLYHGFNILVDSPVVQAGAIGKVLIKVHWDFKEPFASETVAPSN